MWRDVSVNRHACRTDGRMRYSQVLRLRALGTVNAVPDSCSVYRPSGGFCGLFCPRGSAPGSASEASSFPKPDRYSGCVTRWTSVVVVCACVSMSSLLSQFDDPVGRQTRDVLGGSVRRVSCRS